MSAPAPLPDQNLTSVQVQRSAAQHRHWSGIAASHERARVATVVLSWAHLASLRQRIVKRANDGRAAARKRGVHMGRKPKLTELQQRVARERVAKGESARSIAQEWAWHTPP